MSNNDCCCGVTTVPGPTLSPESPCVNNYTIMSQTGLITDINCGIRPVEGEIFGLQMQSTSYDSFVSKEEFVFGYSLTKLKQEVSGLKSEEENFKAYGEGYSSASPWRTPPCYWIWWTKNRCLELDSTFPEQNFSGCINQSDLFYFKNDGSYWCDASPTSTSGAWGHDGESCWRSSLLAPWHFNNLYAEDGNASGQWTMHNAVASLPTNQPSGGFESDGDGGFGDVCNDACWGWGHRGCAPNFDHKMGHNQVGTFTAEGWDDYPGAAKTPFGIFGSYPVNKRSSHNIKYPASTNKERYAAIVSGSAGRSCYKDNSAAGKDASMPRQCWMADHSVPTWFKEDPNVRPPRSCIDEDEVVMTANGLSPYQRRVAKERSPDIWEIHEFNDTYPVKIKVQEFSEDTPANLYIWGKNSSTFKQKINDKNPFNISVGFTSVSANGNKLAVIRKNTRPEIYRFVDNSDSLEETLPTYQSNIVLALDDTGNFADITDLQGAEALRQTSSSGSYTIFGSRAYPRRNYLKKVRTGYDHTICIRENGTAETSLDEVETTGDRQYYARSVPTVIDYNPSAIDYGQKDVPYSPGSKGNSYDWVSHAANGCTQCSGPLFKSEEHVWTSDGLAGSSTPDIIQPCINCDARCAFNDECSDSSDNQECVPPDLYSPPNIKRFCYRGSLGNQGGWCDIGIDGLRPKEPQSPIKPIGSCRFPNTDPDFVKLDCRRPIKYNTPWTQSEYRILTDKPIHNSFPVLGGVQQQTYGWNGGNGYYNIFLNRWEYLGPCLVPTTGSFKTFSVGGGSPSLAQIAPHPYGKLTCQGKNDRVIFTDQYVTNCKDTPTPLCEAGYPPLHCGVVGDVAICGTGGFNDTKHEWFDYMIYTCNRMVIHFDENYCEGIQSWEDISAGGYHNLAINKNSTFVPITDQVPNVIETCVPSLNNPVYQFGDAYNPLRGTNVVGWGAGDNNNSGVCQINNWPNFGQSILPSGLGHCVKVSAGGYHSLAIKSNNKLKAWGAGSVGCLPCTTFNQHNVHFGQSIIPPNLIDVEFIEISAGKFHSCGIRKDNNQVVCWGAGITNQAGGGTCGVNWGQSIIPGGLNRCIKVSAGGYHTCVIKETGEIECWGKNTNGQCDIPGSLENPDDAPQRYIEISCGDEFTAARAQTDAYESFNYYNAHNFLTAPAPTIKNNWSSAYWPVSLFRYFFAFASVEFTYAKGILPAAKGICDKNWTNYLPAAFHQRSDAVHIFAFEMPNYALTNDNPLVEEDLDQYTTSDFPCQMSYGPALSAFTNHEQGFKENSIKVDRMFQSQVYWKDRMDCKDWRGEVWDDIQTLGTAIVITGGQHPWPEFKTIIEKYTNPSLIKPLGAYRIRGDRFDIRDARGHSATTPNAVNLNKKPPELARMVQSSSRIKIPEEYKDHGVYTLQVNKDIYALNVPDSIYLTPEQRDAYNRLTLSVYFRPKPIGWDTSGPDYLTTSDWPTEDLKQRTILGERSWRYGWLGPRSKTNPSSLTDIWTTNVSVGIGSNNIYAQPGLSQKQGQPFWDTRNRGHVGSSQWEGIQIGVLCDTIGPQVAYSGNAHIYVARHLLGIKEVGGILGGLKGPVLYDPKHATSPSYFCKLRKAIN